MQGNRRRDSLPGCNYLIWQDSKEFCFTTDAVFLAAFPHLVKAAKVLELGCGTGAMSLLLSARGADHVVGVDCNANVVELFRQSIVDNELVGRVEALNADLRELKNKYLSESFDLVVANPPYRIGGKKRRIGREACHEVSVTLEDFFQVAALMVKYRGRFALVQLPERFTEAVSLGTKYGLELKKLQWVHSFVDKPAWIFLAEFVKGGAPGLEVLSPLIMYNKDGTHSKQTLAYYGMDREGK
jgi:tRNA1Val (adenine37-N6)-methyltransferase